jgi:hypothetical protein
MAEVDLRPMSIGEVLDRTFTLYKNQFWLFVGITSLPFLVLFCFRVGLAALQSGQLKLGEGNTADSLTIILSAVGGAAVMLILYFFLIGATQAATIFAVSDLYLGRETTVRGAYRQVGTKVFRVLLVIFLVGLATGVGFILLIVPGFIFMCRMALSVPVSMLEDRGAVPSIERSMQLTKDFGMQIFLIFLLMYALSIAATMVFQMPFMILEVMSVVKNHTASFGILFLQNLGTFLTEVLVTPVGTIAFSLMYYNLRVRKEAFDVQHLMASMGGAPAPGEPSAA